ncbi:hypothetical protein L3Q82_016976, partial [Scortum barcoo]
MGGNCFDQELQEIIRTVLGNVDNLQPFSSAHFTVFPHKKRWEGACKLVCKECERKLRVYPFVLILYLERNGQDEKRAEEELSPERDVTRQVTSVCEPWSKRCRSDSPLEEAILKDLIGDMEVESKVSMVGRLHVNGPRAAGEVKEDPGHVDKKGTEGLDEPQQTPGLGVVAGSGTPSEVHSGITQDMGEVEGDVVGEHADSAPGTPVRPGILTRLARLVRRQICKCAHSQIQTCGDDADVTVHLFQILTGGTMHTHSHIDMFIAAIKMSLCMTSQLCLLVLPVISLLLLSPIGWSYDGLTPGCHLHPFNVTIRSDRRGTCKGTHQVYACVGYCESSAFPSRYSVLVASNFTHNITSASQCCTISKDAKVKVRLDCPQGRHHDEIEILTAKACRCD